MTGACRIGLVGPRAVELLGPAAATAGASAGAASAGDEAWVAAGELSGAEADRVRAFAACGRPLLALGAAVASVAGRLGVRLRPAPTGARDLAVVVAGRPTPFTWSLPAGRVVALGRVRLGAAVGPPEEPGRIVLHFSGGDGDLAAGAELGPAAVADVAGRVVGVVVEPGGELLGQLLRALVTWAPGRPGRV